jgi:histidinol-phosphatase (PHP family)
MAIKKKLKLVGLSAHFPYEFLERIEHLNYREYAMPLPELEIFVNSAEEIKKKYKSSIEVKIGFEIDFIEGQSEKHRKFLDKYLNRVDFIIGSIHNIVAKFGLFPFDDFRSLKYYKNYENIDDLFLKYYKTMYEMVNSKVFDFDIIGHFDLPKKFNFHPNNDKMIIEQIIKILEQIKKKGLVIEINSSGLRKPVKQQYPSEEIIQVMREMDNDILLGSDAHHPNELAYKFNKMEDLIRQKGFYTLAHFNKRIKSYIEI